MLSTQPSREPSHLAEQFRTGYGFFDPEHDEYVITRPDTPRPWVNVVCPGDYGFVLSQAGGGYSWRTHASLNRLTRWNQDLIRDDWGRFLYIRDEESGRFWSAAWQPVRAVPERYRVRHGVGYSVIESTNDGITSEWTLFVPPAEPLELWRLRVRNDSDRPRRLALFTYLEWLLGAAPDWHREFHKTFIETAFDKAEGVLWATKQLWELPSRQGQSWNREWEYLAFHSSSEPPAEYRADKEAFLGMYRSLAAPAAVAGPGHLGDGSTVGRWGDAIASLQHRVTLAPGQEYTLVYVLGAVARDERERALGWIRRYRALDQVQAAWERTCEFWRRQLAPVQVHTPDPAFDLMTNTWLKYQALSARLWGRTAYYQTGGAYGFRDQLQDSQIFLELDPARTQEQIRLHAAHQFRAGNALHWWHPLSEQGMVNRISDNRLWLVFVTLNYLKETRDWAFLDESIPYRDDGVGSEATPSQPIPRRMPPWRPALSESGPPGASPGKESDEVDRSLYGHCVAAIEYTLARSSERGLPLIGEGDWNDGMNAVGFGGRGESIWLGEFLHGILQEFAQVAEHRRDRARAARWRQRAQDLADALWRYGWDTQGGYFIRATCDDGTPVGSASCQDGQVFVNAQSWAILGGLVGPSTGNLGADPASGLADGPLLSAAVARTRSPAAAQTGSPVAPPIEPRTDRTAAIPDAARLLAVIRQRLLTPYGPVLLTPAYRHPDERIGYLTRYAPGVRENGGVYLHAAVWALWAAVKGGDAALAWEIYQKINPVRRGLDPDLYKVEPYVTPGNVDGPDSPHAGRGGWTWYTGSAAWLFRISVEWLLGVRPTELNEPDGLRVDPCVPPDWTGFTLIRRFRGATYHLHVENPNHVASGVRRIEIDGTVWTGGTILPLLPPGTEHEVRVILQ